MSEDIKEESIEKVNPFLTPVKIIEPKNKLPDYTFDMLPEEQKAILREHGWTELMPVQRKSIPYMLAARDMLVQSKTGSGKTGAYALPLLQVIVRDHPYPQALILVPTRELCIQVQEEFEKLSKGTGIRSVAIFGGVNYEPQIKALRAGVHVIVATPGRLMDHIQRGNVDLLSITISCLTKPTKCFRWDSIRTCRRSASTCPRRFLARCTVRRFRRRSRALPANSSVRVPNSFHSATTRLLPTTLNTAITLAT